jgi:imidazole glycerol-phosphate synthase subunit HisH
MISIINYGMGNIGSLQNMVSRVGGTADIVSTPDALADANKIILPGVGHFDNAVRKLKTLGLWSVLDEKARAGRVPILCICLGAQLVTEGSEEGTESGFGWIRGRTVRFSFPADSKLRIPHMGWNEVQLRKDCKLFSNASATPLFYFVHSYYMVADDPSDVLTTSYYGLEFASGIARGNIIALQFHPEKSHKHGMNVIRNFVEMNQC